MRPVSAHKGEPCIPALRSEAEDEICDVIIVGAGPGGLSAAIAILKARPDIKLRVLERATAMRPSGGCIGISTSNAFTALEAMGALEAVNAAGVERRDFITADKFGNVLKTQQIPSLIIAWYNLQQALLSCLPANVLRLQSDVREVEEEHGLVTLWMANGSRARARLVIGADGNQSVCRRYVQGDNKPMYVGAAVWRLFLPGDNPFVEVGDSLVMTGDNKVMVMQPTVREGNVVTYCSGITGFDEHRLPELNQTRYVQQASEDGQTLSAKLARFKEQFQSFRADMVEHILSHAVPDSVLEHPMYALDPRQPWSKGRVVLLGDAAHVMPPNLSQGTPSAFEDALQLAASLATHGISDAALAEYEAVRKERVLPIWDASTKAAVGYYKDRREEDNPFKSSSASDSQKAFSLLMNYEPPSLKSLVSIR